MTTTSAGRISLEQIARLPNIYMPVVSYDGRRVAFYSDRSGRMELELIDLASRERRQISHGEAPRSVRSGFVWNRAGTALYFGRDRDGDEQHDLFRIEIASGEVTRLTDDPGVQAHVSELSPDDRWLLIAQNKEGQVNLWRMPADGGDEVRLTDYAFPCAGGTYSPDGRWIAYNVNESADLRNLDGYLMRADGGDKRRIFRVEEGTTDAVVDWSPDGRLLAVLSDASGDNRAGLLTVETGEVRWLSPEGSSETPGSFSNDGRWLFALVNAGSEVRPVLYEVATGARRELACEPGITGAADFVLDDTALLLGHQTERDRGSLLLYHLEDDRSEVIVPAEYGGIDPSLFVAGEHITYAAPDGLSIPALLYRPRELVAGTRLPAIVRVHGGPTAQWFRGFDPIVQLLVDRGYVVIEPNIRGSTGYGREFRDMARFDWGGGDLDDVAGAVAYLRSLPYVDGERIGIEGGSYGGYMTYIAATKRPELWKSAYAAVGITDIALLYAGSMSHFQYYLRQQMGDPEERAELWRDRSALTWADQLQAKLLISHGANDPRCPLDQATVFRDRLLELGRREGEHFEYAELGDEGHSTQDPEQKIRSYRMLLDWFERTL